MKQTKSLKPFYPNGKGCGLADELEYRITEFSGTGGYGFGECWGCATGSGDVSGNGDGSGLIYVNGCGCYNGSGLGCGEGACRGAGDGTNF